MTITHDAAMPAGLELSAEAALWADDLAWHRHMYRESRYRWTGQDVVDILTWRTGGQMNFTNVTDLEALQTCQSQVAEYGMCARSAMAERLKVAYGLLGGWGPVTALLGLTELECKSSVWFLRTASPEERTSVNVQRVLKFVPFRNPLIEAWELKQLVRLYEAAVAMAEDAICDLVEELLPTRDVNTLAAVAHSHTQRGLELRIQGAREQRGEVGDTRRIPEQVFF